MGQIALSNVSKAYYTSRKKDEARIVLKDGVHTIAMLPELKMPPCCRKALIATEDEEKVFVLREMALP